MVRPANLQRFGASGGSNFILDGRVGKKRVEDKAGKRVENEDLWREMKAGLEERTMPWHVDIEGNERADEMANEGVKKHGKKMRDEKEQEVAEGVREQRRKRRAEEEANTVEFKSTPRKSFPPKRQMRCHWVRGAGRTLHSF